MGSTASEVNLGPARRAEASVTGAGVVGLGSWVVLEDLDDATREGYVLVSSAESNPAAGQLSSESPVGRAISGHRRGDVVDALAPLRVRHLLIAELDTTA